MSSFSPTRSLVVLYGYVSIESVDCILLSSFELKAVLLISSVKTLCLSFLNLCCVFNINILFFYINKNSLFILYAFSYKERNYLCQLFF